MKRSKRVSTYTANQGKVWKKELDKAYREYLRTNGIPKKVSTKKYTGKSRASLELDELAKDQIVPEGIPFFDTKLNDKIMKCSHCGCQSTAEEFDVELIEHVTIAHCPCCEEIGYVLLYRTPKVQKKKKS